MRIAVVDYGAGNLASVVRGLRAAGGDPIVVRTPGELAGARGIVIPGVGHFAATRALDDAWRTAFEAMSPAHATPILGICLGMQWLFEGSDEAPDVPGLALFAGRVTRLASMGGDGERAPVKVPHVGWNTLERMRASTALDGICPGTAVYFTHTFAAAPTSDATAITTHGLPFASIVERGRVWGAQFHPEKSGKAGARLLENWIRRCCASA